jgi:putative ABC transport system substrate-binding protein
MDKKILIWLLATLLLGTVPAAAQQSAKVPRIAFLAGGSRSGDSLLIETFWQRMKELGYIEGKNIVAEYRFAEGENGSRTLRRKWCVLT